MSGLNLGMVDSRDFCRSSMRDSTLGINFDALGEVEHYEHISGEFFDLLNSGDHSDVTFIVEGVRFQAHRVVLGARCKFFKVLLFGDMKEAKTNLDIPILDTTPDSFRALLEYIYSGRVCLGDLSDQVNLDLLGLANKYDFGHLQSSIMAYLKATLNVSNVCLVYNVASFYQLKELCLVCTFFVDMNASAVLKNEGFLSLSQQALIELLSRDSFFAPEIEIYQGIRKWMEVNQVPIDDCKPLLKVIRLHLLPTKDLLSNVRHSGYYQPDQILDAITIIEQKKPLEVQQRGMLIPEENVASLQQEAMVSDGQHVLLNGDTENYTGEQGYAVHTISKDLNKGITVQLNQPYILNCIKMLLWDKDNRSYSYYIQMSLDGHDWVTVIDRRDHLCRSWQELFFKDRVVRYIRITGTFNSMNRSFHLVSFSCLYTNHTFPINSDGLMMPTENVASITAGATVLEGVSRSRNALLNGNTRDYDWDSGYTCHQLGSGSIIVQLAQPYHVSSMRLLLWDCDERTYRYYIETSTDQKKWVRVTDKTTEECRSWQAVQFEAHPVTFVKIVGTNNTANEVFHCVHFECPAKSLNPKQLPSY